MSKASPAEKKKAKKRRRARHKRRMKAAGARRRAEKERQHAGGRKPQAEPDDWPDTDGLSEEEAARVMGEFFYWEDYFDRNPGPAVEPAEAPGRRRRRRRGRAKAQGSS